MIAVQERQRYLSTEQDLALQGFSVLDLQRDAQSLEDCQKDAGSLRRRLKAAPEELLDCFLGKRGSARFCEIPFDEPSSRRMRCENLRDLSASVHEAVGSLKLMGASSLLGCLLHETGTWDSRSAPPLQERDVERWLPRLLAGQLTAIVALGTAVADVELHCMGAEVAVVEVADESEEAPDAAEAADVSEEEEEDEEKKPRTKLVSRGFPARPHHIRLPAGRLLLVRPDVVWQLVAGDAGDFTVSWMFGGKPEVDWAVLSKPRQPDASAPGLLRLQSWLSKRLEQRRACLEVDSRITEWRVMVPYVYKLKAPKTPTFGADRVEVFSKGDIVLGATETVDNNLWLETLTGQPDVHGQKIKGYIAMEVDGALEQAIQPVRDFLPAWQTISAHMSSSTCHQTVIRGASSKFATTHDVRLFWPPHMAGADFCIEVPLGRWDHTPYFFEDDDDERSQDSRVFCKHGAFMDGAELFDNKRFQISPAEVISMDPQQRMALECAEEAFFHSGLNREALVRSVSGVYVGAGMHEWTVTPNCARDASADMYGCTGGSTAIHSNRISFNLGLMGPSITVICEGASSLVTLERGFVSLDPQKSDNVRALSMGVSTMLVPATWIILSQAGIMWNGSVHGRCMAFAAEASGYVRGEGCGCVVQSVLRDEESEPNLGMLRSARSTQQAAIAGRAGLHAPNGPAEKALVSEAVSMAKLEAVSVDAVDCNAEGRLLSDAIELAAISTILCPEGQDESRVRPLPLIACKSNQAHCLEAAGVCALLRILFSTRTCCHAAPLQHLYSLNPMIGSSLDFDAFGCQLPTELVRSRSRDAIVGVKGHSIVGTMGMLLVSISKQQRPDTQESSTMKSLSFWPAGAVSLPAHALPQKGYEVIGSWNDWTASVPMMRRNESGREHVWTADLPLASGGLVLVTFQILLDGDPEKILHPGCVAAGPNTRVLGPHPSEQLARSISWCAALSPEALQGDTCRIELFISGSWRAVSWLGHTSL